MEFAGVLVVAGGIGAGIGASVGQALNFITVRGKMKANDQEREQERIEERQTSTNMPLEVGINHFKHEHPLDEVNDSNINSQFVCKSCGKSGNGRRYLKCNVEGCDFKLHKVCASPPVLLHNFQPLNESSSSPRVETLQTFAHPPHLVREVFRHAESYTCLHCNLKGNGIRYRCDACKVDLHPICAKSPTRLLSFMHPEHELELMTRSLTADCAVCGHGGMFHNDRVYACQICKFYVHPLCSMWPQYLFHELHPVLHPLQFLKVPSETKCKGCNKKCKDSLYYCSNCNEGFHPECLSRFTRSGTMDGRMHNFRRELLTHTAFFVVSSALH